MQTIRFPDLEALGRVLAIPGMKEEVFRVEVPRLARTQGNGGSPAEMG